MASIRKHGKGWRAEVARAGKRTSKVFATKREAVDWAARSEYLIINGEAIAADKTFGEVMSRYAAEVSPSKRGEKWEVLRLEKLQRDPIAKHKIGDLSATHLAAWRERRLREVSPSSVRREMVLMSGVLTVARKDWGLISESPMTDVRKPSAPPPRDRLVTQAELQRVRLVAGDDLTKTTTRAFHAFLFACETAMRAGEIVGLTWDKIDIERSFLRLETTKNGLAREVPLSSEAIRLLLELPRLTPVFGLKSASLDALWRKLRDAAGLSGLTFHDSRHAAITKLSRKLDVLALARMVGHRDLKQLMVYYNESASDLAKRLD